MLFKCTAEGLGETRDSVRKLYIALLSVYDQSTAYSENSLNSKKGQLGEKHSIWTGVGRRTHAYCRFHCQPNCNFIAICHTPHSVQNLHVGKCCSVCLYMKNSNDSELWSFIWALNYDHDTKDKLLAVLTSPALPSKCMPDPIDREKK